MKRTFLAKLLVLGGAVAMALFLTVYRPSPEGLLPFGVGQAEVRAAPGAKAKPAHDLSDLKIVNLTLQKVHDFYVDPQRIDPRDMLLASLDYVQRNVAEVLVEVSDDGSRLTVQVNDKRQTFNVGDIDSLWGMHRRMKQIFRFIQANKNPTSDAADIEYVATNGLLSTLDPHSVLLDPEAAEEMTINTSGKFGGIGIIIHMSGELRNQLAVKALIHEDTPAAKAGLQAGDKIVGIDGFPTANITLNEAMTRLRGDPNTKVTVTLERKGRDKPFDVVIIRDRIRVPSVKSRLLDKGVGHLRIDSFSASTADELKKAIKDLKDKGAKAWVLDLRGNPGGLLDQAIKVTDLFVDSGTLVTTVQYAGKERDEKRAHASRTVTRAPMVVLVDSQSASASEIVAGALKQLNRAAILGRSTFGKGSVQVLYKNEDGSQLKLTIAQYLTPGDVSIQSVGIVPDVELVPLWVPDKLETWRDVVRLRETTRAMREADLDAHLTSKNARQTEQPLASVRYVCTPNREEAVAPEETQAEENEEMEAPPVARCIKVPDMGDDLVEDYEVRFARDFVLATNKPRRSDMLPQLDRVLRKVQASEEKRLVDALAKLGIDWHKGPKSGRAHLVATFSTDKPQNRVTAGDVIAITGTVTNTGTGPAYRVHAMMKSDDWTFDDTELVFGRIDPGRSRTFTARVKLPQSAQTRMDKIRFEFEEAYDAPADSEPLKVSVAGLERPVFAYAAQLVDENGGNGDGLVQRGEELGLHVTVRNVGPGKSHRTSVSLKNASMDGDNVLVDMGRVEFKEIPPGSEKDIDFKFKVLPKLRGDEVVLELLVYDHDLHESLREKIRLPVRNPDAGPQVASGHVKVQSRTATVFEGAADDSSPVATARRGSVFKMTGRSSGWIRVKLPSGLPGFLPARDATTTRGSGKARLEPVWQVTPPTVIAEVPSLETTGAKWRLKGKARDETHVEDLFVIVSNRDAKIDGKKVFYKSNRNGNKDTRELAFDTEIPVWPGNNMVTIVARESNEVRTVKTLFIYRTDGENKVAGATPKPESQGEPATAQ